MRDKRIHILMTESELIALDAWRFGHKIGSRGEAVRRLIYAGVAATTPSVVGRIHKRAVRAEVAAESERCAQIVDAKAADLASGRDRMLVALLQDLSREIRGQS